MDAPTPTFPPLLTGHALTAGETPLEVARARARAGDIGAGDVLWSPDEQRAALAIVLEPECLLGEALQMVPLAQVAAGDCIGALAPPKVAVVFRWPSQIVVNGGVAGAIEAAWPEGCSLRDMPDWLVVSATFEIKFDAREPEPGFNPERTVLAEEGCLELTSARLIESYSRHFLTWLNEWQDDGFRAVGEAWVFRADGREGELEFIIDGAPVRGRVLGLDAGANLILKPGDAAAMSVPIVEALAGAIDARSNEERP